MAMSVQAWCRRLGGELPGWHFWYQTGGNGTGWWAVPAPSGMAHAETLGQPNRLGPCRTAQRLRTECRERYGWYDDCQSCGVPARRCGHRQPEHAR